MCTTLNEREREEMKEIEKRMEWVRTGIKMIFDLSEE